MFGSSIYLPEAFALGLLAAALRGAAWWPLSSGRPMISGSSFWPPFLLRWPGRGPGGQQVERFVERQFLGAVPLGSEAFVSPSVTYGP